MKKPIIGIPIGDPAGIGPEIVVKALSEKEIYDICMPLVIGDIGVVKNALKYCNIKLNINSIGKASQGEYKEGIINLIDLANIDIKFKMGKIQSQCGKAAFEYIKKTVDMALLHEIDALATAPINKEALKAAQIDYIGHTEILASLTNTHDPLTMFEVRNLRVFFLTRHVSLSDACKLVTKGRILDYITRCNQSLKMLGVTDGTMAIAGLNPHSGEGGLLGSEEIDKIIPAINEAKELGFKVDGPIGADSVFHLALQGRFNSVLSLYHDQGHIATKTLDFERTIALTLGLPFLRTSVDHGTAFDIAGTGKASAVSMIEAIKIAAKYAKGYSA